MTATLTDPTPVAAPPTSPAVDAIGKAWTATVSTPTGPFTVITIDADLGPTVIASGWTDDLATLLPQVAPVLRPAVIESVPAIDRITELIVAYHEGDLAAIDTVPVRQDSGPFLELLWDTLRAVTPGEPVTYTELAGRAGRIRAARAAGSACSRNAAALFVPCHRVVPAGGGVGGFRWGPDVKRWLLRHEEQNA